MVTSIDVFGINSSRKNKHMKTKSRGEIDGDIGEIETRNELIESAV